MSVSAIEKRLNALKNLQIKLADVELKLYQEVNQLESKYSSLFDPIYDEREKIISGEHEPTDEEAKWEYEDSNKDLNNNETSAQENGSSSSSEEAKGLPDFWLKVLKTANLTSSIIEEHDEPILKHLKDIRVKIHDKEPYGFTLAFHFNENEYFKNQILEKTYELTTERDEKNPLLSQSTSLKKSYGTKIEWNEGKNVSVGTSKNKSNGSVKEVKQDTFFDLFETHTQGGLRPSLKDKSGEKKEGDFNSDEEEELENLIELDYEIGTFIREALVSKALLYYLGEIRDGNDFEGFGALDDSDDSEDEEESSDDDRDSEAEKPRKKSKKE